MIVRTGRGEEFDLTTCEVCGMWWTAAKHEPCPRCGLAVAELRIEEASRRTEEILHELTMLESR